MRIGLFSDTYLPEINGVASSVDILRNELESHGHDVYVITTFAGEGHSRWEEEGKVLRLAGVELKFLYGYVMTSPFHFFAYDEVKKLNLDLIHAHTEFGVGIFAHICAKHLDIPLVSTYHTTYEDYTHYVNFIHSDTVDALAKKGVAKLSRLYGNSSLEIIAPSQKTKEMLQGYDIVRDIAVIPTGLRLENFSPALLDEKKSHEIRSAYGFTDEDYLVIYVGRLAAEKSMDIVVRGFAKAIDAGVDVKLLIVGKGPDEENLRQMAKDLGKETSIVCAGPKQREEVPDYYRASDAFISASLSETQGMTFIEALASGLPLFAREDEVLNDLLIPGKTGEFFADEDDLVEKLRDFRAKSREELASCKDACVKQVEPWSSEQFYQKVIAVYERVVEQYRHLQG